MNLNYLYVLVKISNLCACMCSRCPLTRVGILCSFPLTQLGVSEPSLVDRKGMAPWPAGTGSPDQLW